MKPMLDGPIPGQSLTSEPGSRPWERPPKYTTVEEALTFHIDNLGSNPKKLASVLDKIEEGAPIALIADTLQTIGVSKGLHTLDVGILVSPVLIEYMKTLAEAEGIDYVIGTEDDARVTERDDASAQVIAKSVFKKSDVDVTEAIEANISDADDMQEEEEEPVSRGLMARRPSDMPMEAAEEPTVEAEMPVEGESNGI
jgi:hypothetical protein